MQYSSAKNPAYALTYNESRFWNLLPWLAQWRLKRTSQRRDKSSLNLFAADQYVLFNHKHQISNIKKISYICIFREQGTKSVEFNPHYDFGDMFYSAVTCILVFQIYYYYCCYYYYNITKACYF
jgi:hypothetical protein